MIDENEQDLKQGTIIEAGFPEIGTIIGEICGIALKNTFAIYTLYIVKILEYSGKIDRSTYPYSHMSLQRNMFKIKDKKD